MKSAALSLEAYVGLLTLAVFLVGVAAGWMLKR